MYFKYNFMIYFLISLHTNGDIFLALHNWIVVSELEKTLQIMPKLDSF